MIFLVLLLLAPASLALAYLLHTPPLWIFAASVHAIVPLAVYAVLATAFYLVAP